MFLLLAQVDPGKATELVQPALSILDKTVIGSVLVVSWVITVAAIVLLVRVQNARVMDQKTLSEKSEKLMDKMVTAFADMRGALESLKEAETSGQRATEALKSSIDSMKQQFDLLLMTRRSFTPPGIPKRDIDRALKLETNRDVEIVKHSLPPPALAGWLPRGGMSLAGPKIWFGLLKR